MNVYFLFFSAYALLITRITLHVSLRLGKRSGYRVRMQAAGVPFMYHKQDDPALEHPICERDVAQTLASTNLAPLRALLKKRVRMQIKRSFHMEELSVKARISFENVAATALCFMAVRTLLETLSFCRLTPKTFSSHIEANLHQQSSEVLFHCIVSARLGSLGLAAILFGAAFIRARSKHAQSEEEGYATAPH